MVLGLHTPIMAGIDCEKDPGSAMSSVSFIFHSFDRPEKTRDHRL